MSRKKVAEKREVIVSIAITAKEMDFIKELERRMKKSRSKILHQFLVQATDNFTDLSLLETKDSINEFVA
jgi:hypothetical protein